MLLLQLLTTKSKKGKLALQMLMPQLEKTKVYSYKFVGINNLDMEISGEGLHIVTPDTDAEWVIESHIILSRKLEKITKIVIEEYDLS